MTLSESVQGELDFAPLVTPEHTPDQSIADRYAAWITANPWVLRRAASLVAQRVEKGYARVGIKEVFEVIRWQYGERFTPADGHKTFKANNDYTSRLARDLIRLHPEWTDVIKTRALRTH